jgi:hypothetical protein
MRQVKHASALHLSKQVEAIRQKWISEIPSCNGEHPEGGLTPTLAALQEQPIRDCVERKQHHPNCTHCVPWWRPWDFRKRIGASVDAKAKNDSIQNDRSADERHDGCYKAYSIWTIPKGDRSVYHGHCALPTSNARSYEISGSLDHTKVESWSLRLTIKVGWLFRL